ncbi:DUF3800 domain-containing protein [Paenarthrobacter ilicis]|uniref:DUF3800 domain-containing protein n=1 Tax=Paenarthrobacter ilicis TaxID=43665 RepID=UPI0028D7AE6B|nr:DUF3800 domain-containing protein [Paenarthrobacter ilicis]
MTGVGEVRTLYVFVDESGNFDFTNKGTDHFVISAVFTDDPCRSAAALQTLKYDLLASRSDQLEFHATENSRGTRARVTQVIRELSQCIRVHSIYADKHYAHRSLHSPVAMLSLFGKALARWVAVAVGGNHDQVVLVFDSVLTGKQRDAFMKAVKPALKALEKPFHVAFHPVKSDLNGQIADYFAWSVFRSLEAKDPLPLEALVGISHSKFNIFERGHTRYW